MSADKYALLEARIRQTASLVARLREENQLLVQENEQLCARIAELEEELQRARRPGAESAPNLDHLLEQLDTLHQADSPRQLRRWKRTSRRRTACPPKSRKPRNRRRKKITFILARRMSGAGSSSRPFRSTSICWRRMAITWRWRSASRSCLKSSTATRRPPRCGTESGLCGRADPTGSAGHADRCPVHTLPRRFIMFSNMIPPQLQPPSDTAPRLHPYKFITRLWENTNANMRTSCVERCCVDLGVV